MLMLILYLSAKPRIQAAPPLLKALNGQTVTLPCVVHGEPSPEVRWFHNGLPVEVRDTATLRIQRVSRSNQGTYRCVAKNNAGQDTLEINLEVLGGVQSVCLPQTTYLTCYNLLLNLSKQIINKVTQ